MHDVRCGESTEEEAIGMKFIFDATKFHLSSDLNSCFEPLASEHSSERKLSLILDRQTSNFHHPTMFKQGYG